MSIKKTERKRPVVTRDRFLENEARRNNVSLEDFKKFIRESGTKAERCRCGHRVCLGWMLVDRASNTRKH